MKKPRKVAGAFWEAVDDFLDADYKVLTDVASTGVPLGIRGGIACVQAAKRRRGTTVRLDGRRTWLMTR